VSKPTIVTLCWKCKQQYEEGGFSVKPYPGKPTTEKKATCEQCRKRFLDMKQYLVTAKGGKR